jgi:acyl carrier protein
MDLFHFTMQQLAPNPLRFGEGDPQTVRAYLRHWLQRHHHSSEPSQLWADSQSSNLLKLDALGWSKLQADVTEFYGLQMPKRSLEGLSTIESLETYVQQQLLQAAA